MLEGLRAIPAGDVVVLHMPNYLGGGSGTSHGTPFPYDTHVPVIFWGPGHLVKRGQYHRDAAVHDIVTAALDRATQILRANRALLERGAQSLLAKETLVEAELAELKRGLVAAARAEPDRASATATAGAA